MLISLPPPGFSEPSTLPVDDFSAQSISGFWSLTSNVARDAVNGDLGPRGWNKRRGGCGMTLVIRPSPDLVGEGDLFMHV